jgi:hypothetical protein
MLLYKVRPYVYVLPKPISTGGEEGEDGAGGRGSRQAAAALTELRRSLEAVEPLGQGPRSRRRAMMWCARGAGKDCLVYGVLAASHGQWPGWLLVARSLRGCTVVGAACRGLCARPGRRPFAAAPARTAQERLREPKHTGRLQTLGIRLPLHAPIPNAGKARTAQGPSM